MKGLPAFSFQAKDFVYVEMVGEGVGSGVRQFNDIESFLGAIKLTADQTGESFVSNPFRTRPLVTGERVLLEKKGREIKLLRKGWIAASQRIALGIPLHPDRMEESDWTALPGIGSVLAERIEKDRQKNGDFDSLKALLRVKGIGKKSIEKWSGFF